MRMHTEITFLKHYLPHLPRIFHEIGYDIYATVEDGRYFSISIPEAGIEEDEDGEELQTP